MREYCFLSWLLQHLHFTDGETEALVIQLGIGQYCAGHQEAPLGIFPTGGQGHLPLTHSLRWAQLINCLVLGLRYVATDLGAGRDLGSLVRGPRANLLPFCCTEGNMDSNPSILPLLEPIAQSPTKMSTGPRQVAQVRTEANHGHVSGACPV